MSQATYIQDMMAEPAPDLATGPGEIASFYAGQNILITGGSGFLGRLLLERLLRSCPDLNTVFLLLRAKKGRSPEDRFKELFNDVIFDQMKRERPGFAEKVILIKGDISEAGLGVTPEDRELLRSTHIVIHCAATVKFDEPLRIAANINVKGTRELVLLAHEMADLKAFVHISTAYSNCVHEVIEEKFYEPPIDSEKLLTLLDILDDAALNHLTPVLLGRWPNTYVFTKAIAEDIIRRNCESLPMCVVRPSIVIATAKEPMAGWINNIYGPTGITVGVGLGVLRTLHCDGELVADLIPGDYVISNIIVSAWYIAKSRSINLNREDCSMIPESEVAPIYNVVSSCQRPITWGQFTSYGEKYGSDIPSAKTVWYFCFKLHKYRWVHNICVIFLQNLPGHLFDAAARLIGQKPMLMDAYQRIANLSSVLEYFTTRQWRFQNNNAVRLWKSLSPVDRGEFDLNIANLNWEDFSYHHVRGLRVYIVKDPLDTLPQARAKYAKLKIAHYTVVTAFYAFIFWLLLTFLRFIGLW